MSRTSGRSWWQAVRATLLALVLAGSTSGALAGIVVSLEGEMERLQALEQLIRDLETADANTDTAALTARWEELREEFERIGRVPDMPQPVRERRVLELNRSLAELGAELETLRDAVVFPKAGNRVAVFAFDDPAGLGVGDALSFLVAKHLLFSTRTRSFAVVNFQQGAAPERPGGPAYFDKVDKLTAGQGYSVALWGRISSAADRARVEMFGQAFPSLDPPRYAHTLALPRAMGGETLVASLTHDRFKLATIELPPELIARLPDIAAMVRTLRASPSVRASKTGTLNENAPYFIAAAEGDWVQLQVRGGPGGWTSVRAFCTGACAQLLPAVDFANEVVAAGAGEEPRAPAEALDTDAQFLFRELNALHALRSQPERAMRLTSNHDRFGARGAGLANIHALATAAAGLGSMQDPEAYAQRRLAQSSRESAVQALAAAVAYDPNARWTQRNLATLTANTTDARYPRLALLAGRRRALVVGNSAYERMPALRYAVADAQRVHDALLSGGYDSRLLIDAGGAALRGALQELGTSGAVTVYFAGHVVAVNGRAYLMPADADPRQAPLEGVALEKLAVSGRDTTVVLDARLPEDLDEASLRRSSGEASSVLFIEPGDARAADIGAGPLAYLLSQGLRDAAADRNGDDVVTLAEMAAYINQAARRFELPLSVKAITAARASAALVAAPARPR